MGKFVQFAHDFTTDDEWHYLAATFQRYDIDTLTNMWARRDLDDLRVGGVPYQFVEITAEDFTLGSYSL